MIAGIDYLTWARVIIIMSIGVAIGLGIGYSWGQRRAYRSGFSGPVHLEPYSFDDDNPTIEGPP